MVNTKSQKVIKIALARGAAQGVRRGVIRSQGVAKHSLATSCGNINVSNIRLLGGPGGRPAPPVRPACRTQAHTNKTDLTINVLCIKRRFRHALSNSKGGPQNVV